MDPIIRSAPVSPVAREIGRRRPPTVPASKQDAPAGAPIAAAVTASGKAPTAVPALATEATASELKLEKALRERDAELAQLRGQLEKIKSDLGTIHAETEKKGYAAGEAKGEKAATALLQDQIERVKSMAAEIGRARRAAMDDAEDAMVEIVHAAVCRILGEQGAARDTIGRLVREASAGARDQVIVRLHPEDVALIRSAPEAGEETVRLVADATVRMGGCIVDSGTGSLDTRFETQMELLGAALLAARAARKREGGS